MAADDQPEMSLFVRIKDCVLTELRRGRGETRDRAPCKSRDFWNWSKKLSDGIARSEKNANDSAKTEKMCAKNDDASTDETLRQRDKRQSGDTENNDSTGGDNRSRAQHKCKPLRHCPIKMQDPEAPICCEFTKSSEPSPANTKKMHTAHEAHEKSRSTKPCCSCNR